MFQPFEFSGRPLLARDMERGDQIARRLGPLIEEHEVVFEVQDVLHGIGHAVGTQETQLGRGVGLIAMRPTAIERVRFADHAIPKTVFCRNDFGQRRQLLHVTRQLLVAGVITEPRDFVGKKDWGHTEEITEIVGTIEPCDCTGRATVSSPRRAALATGVGRSVVVDGALGTALPYPAR